ncbi:SMP-30/gluconolactonase/LRE family protein [Bradyrhizobium sp. 24]|jgi:streptogramin lyase|uniref:SMP-30/gluconolactonase/LRE family protein n=1 Tax=unclassified Bradyrhizobium TaxID=2631580 RepID=UPI000486019D|nr:MULTISPECIES: SMP-30/gluconolactonase/LRE family protein [unclassified Bradyrhizobium]MCK1382233.1 SMP-30/gluconolactonase/LRE family protein [Bradyrhizobium sp. 24]MCK1299558.1 SMP-30/gluconolactonase/LRE family protein [Bradyrhizobium sp. 37]MCK1398515.1 SMP-30/gluconolactonase/LRE family protein [Bradyrhizobium sp. 39]MCK1751759.1 SMP-30/gluconolactonase/LRE family protein [Bradyrhizobium sp. 135]MCK1768909.1 SMP-30/gluconolactonase/LRE family protein [Bradyrhizobium sp. 134]
MKNRLACAAFVAAIVSATSVSAENWEVTKLVPGSAFHGVHGLAIDKAGHLFAGSVAGAALYEVDIAGGTAKVAIPAPVGMADDIAFAPDGTMAWTGFLAGDLYSRKGDGPIKKLASGLPGINSLAFRKDGRLYATTVFLGDTLYEIDVEGVKPPRQIMEKMGGLNGFEFGPDDKLYGPLWFKGQVARVDVDKAELTVVADGFKVPAAVNFDSKGNLWVVDTALGQLVRLDPNSGAKTMMAQLKPSLDNLAIDDKDRIYVSNMADNGIQEVDPATGQARQVIIGKLALPGGIGVTSENGKDTIHVADVFAYRTVDGATGEVTEKARMHAAGVTLEYPMSATAKGNDVVLSSWFTGTVQVIDGKTGATRDMLHGFKAPHDALVLADGSILVAELGTKSLVRVSGEHGKDRTTLIGGLEGPVGLVAGSRGEVYATEAFSGVVSMIESNGEKTVIAKDLKMPEGIARASDGKLIVAEVGAKRLIEIAPESGTITEIAANLPIGLSGAPGGLPTHIPTGVGIGESGTIYFSSDIENAIYKVTKK